MAVLQKCYKEGNKWNRNAYQKCRRGKNSEEYGNVCIFIDTVVYCNECQN
jgi:hypothetical protein